MQERFTEDDFIAAIVDSIVSETQTRRGSYVEVHVPSIVSHVAGVQNESDFNADAHEVAFLAAWDLCRRGILRPLILNTISAGTLRGNYLRKHPISYAVTPHGIEWAKTRGKDYLFVPFAAGSAIKVFEGFRNRFGDAFVERSAEAVRCFNANLFLACCAMCGAAAESVLLSIAFIKVGDKDKVLEEYRGAGGRKRIEDRILGSQKPDMRDRIRAYLDVLNYWRDSAAHGAAVGITEPQAELALEKLNGLSHFVSSRWQELTT